MKDFLYKKLKEDVIYSLSRFDSISVLQKIPYYDLDKYKDMIESGVPLNDRDRAKILTVVHYLIGARLNYDGHCKSHHRKKINKAQIIKFNLLNYERHRRGEISASQIYDFHKMFLDSQSNYQELLKSCIAIKGSRNDDDYLKLIKQKEESDSYVSNFYHMYVNPSYYYFKEKRKKILEYSKALQK